MLCQTHTQLHLFQQPHHPHQNMDEIKVRNFSVQIDNIINQSGIPDTALCYAMEFVEAAMHVNYAVALVTEPNSEFSG